jgi:uncharacterized membrane protein YdjX (TVP38/TMEM64 family)
MGGPVVLVFLMVLQMFLLFVPNILVMMISIIMYGPFWGAIISLHWRIRIVLIRLHD